jgi:hypothetical protein
LARSLPPTILSLNNTTPSNYSVGRGCVSRLRD